MLGLAPSPDPVTIIVAAQVRLRRWRRAADGDLQVLGDRSKRIRRITEARDTLLRGSCTTGSSIAAPVVTHGSQTPAT